MEREVTLRERGAALVVSKRFPVRLSEIGGAMGMAFGEVYGHLGAQRVAAAGPPFVIYHGMPDGDQPFDIEVCAPVPRAVDPFRGWQTQELTAGTFVTTLHLGPYTTLGTTYAALSAWIGERDLSMAGPPREVYLSEPGTPPEQTRTIVEFPVARLGGPAA